MDEENGTTVKLNVELNSCLLGILLVAWESSVKKSEGLSHGSENEELNDGPEHVEKHRASDSETDFAEPEMAEIWETTRWGEHVQGETLFS